MPARRTALGRGLDALLPGAPLAAPAASTAIAPRERDRDEAVLRADAPGEIPVDEIAPNPEQPRRLFDASELEALAASIGRHGVLQPVVVRRAPPGAARPYELVVGERRWRASQLAGRRTIPATVQDVAPDALLEVALVENIQRADLNPIELALAFRALTDGGWTQEQVGGRVGLDRSTVANHLRLLDLPRELQQDVETGQLTAGHAKALLQLANPERRRHLRDRIVSQGLSVRASEEMARELAGPGARRRRRAASPPETVDPNLRDLVSSLQAKLQTRVRVSGTAERGRIEIEFYGAEELHRLALTILEGA